MDTTDWNTPWSWAAGAIISTLDDMHTWARDLATGKLLTPATQQQREQFLPAPDEGECALYGIGIMNLNGWIGHDGNVLGYIAYPFYLPAQQIRQRPGLMGQAQRRALEACRETVRTM